MELPLQSSMCNMCNICYYKYVGEQEKDAAVAAFLKYKPRPKRIQQVVSTDGVLSMPVSPRIAREPCPRRRPRAERTRAKLRVWIHDFIFPLLMNENV